MELEIGDGAVGLMKILFAESPPGGTAMRRLAIHFRGILRSKDIHKFDVWLNDAQQSGIFAIHRFARPIWRDIDAVRKALTEGWSNS